jgi:predicted hydrolase (HD superfamily)
MIAVSAIMRGLAHRLNENPDLWEITGLLHDIDFEVIGDDFERHGILSIEILADLLPLESLHAIKSHNELTCEKLNSKMDIALIAADAMSGLAIATALMMPNKKLNEVKIRSLKKKFKDRSFARNINRNRIRLFEKLELDYGEFLQISLKALQEISDKLEL